jgi:transposase
LDLSRKRLDFHLLDADCRGRRVAAGYRRSARPDRATRSSRRAIQKAIESMNGARIVHDRLELAGWQVAIADAQLGLGLLSVQRRQG